MEKITPWKINGWNLQITHLERNMIFQISMILVFMLIFRGVVWVENSPQISLSNSTRPQDVFLQKLGRLEPMV